MTAGRELPLSPLPPLRLTPCLPSVLAFCSCLLCLQGTLTHMAPEHLMLGRCSKASDVYAFGILLWEVATGGKAFAGVSLGNRRVCVL